MATVKVTFTLDEPAIAQLEAASKRLGLSKSEVVREAIGEFRVRTDRLSERERREQLRILDELLVSIPPRSAAEVEAELTDIRTARRGGGRLTPAGR